MLREATVGHLLRGSGQETEVLLGLRDSLFLNGVWNGPGGKLEPGESIPIGLKREVREEIEVEIDLTSAKHFATADFYHPVPGSVTYTHEWRVHYFRITRWSGEPRPVEGFRELRWFLLHALPYEKMVVDQVAWLPLALSHLRNGNGSLLKVVIFYGDNKLKTVARGQFQFVEKTA